MSNSNHQASIIDDSIGPNDVLLGRGGKTNSHVGNKRYRAIVAKHQTQYLVARKNEKVLIARSIVSIIQDKGGRFLKRTLDNQLEEVTDKKAQEKTSQALREGLDVRNKAMRPSKMFRNIDHDSPLSQDESKASHQNKSKNNKKKTSRPVVTNQVMFQRSLTPASPALVSVSTTAANEIELEGFPGIPDLQEEFSDIVLSFESHPLDGTDIHHLYEI